MKLCLAATLAALILATTLASASEAAKIPDPQAAFDRLKSLAGNWEAPGKNGNKTHTGYEVVANGTAGVEHFVDDSMGAANAMVTVYYLDGDLEVMSTSEEHERINERIGGCVDDYLIHHGIANVQRGQATIRLIEESGAEPDKSWCIGQEKTFPDLVLEIALTSGGLPKLEIFRIGR